MTPRQLADLLTQVSQGSITDYNNSLVFVGQCAVVVMSRRTLRVDTSNVMREKKPIYDGGS